MAKGIAKDFLDSEEKYLFEELRLVQKMMSEAEGIYSRWENLFIIAEGILLAATSQLLLKSILFPLSLVIGCFGIALSFLFLIIQYGNFIYARARYSRWVDIEQFLKKPLTNKDGLFMAIIEYQNIWRNKYRKYGFLGYPTWYARICIPVLFIFIWLIFSIYSIYLMLNINI